MKSWLRSAEILAAFRCTTLFQYQNIHCLLELNMPCDCVTRGCGDHSPLTTAAILEWRRRSTWGGAAAARRGQRGLVPGRPGSAGRCSPVGSAWGELRAVDKESATMQSCKGCQIAVPGTSFSAGEGGGERWNDHVASRFLIKLLSSTGFRSLLLPLISFFRSYFPWTPGGTR